MLDQGPKTKCVGIGITTRGQSCLNELIILTLQIFCSTVILCVCSNAKYLKRHTIVAREAGAFVCSYVAYTFEETHHRGKRGRKSLMTSFHD